MNITTEEQAKRGAMISAVRLIKSLCYTYCDCEECILYDEEMGECQFESISYEAPREWNLKSRI